MTIAQQPFNSVFRKPRTVRIYRPDIFNTGVIVRNTDVIEAEVNFSVQRLSDDRAKALEERGIVGRELKRLFGHVFLPMENEAVVGYKTGAPEPIDFIFDESPGVTRIAQFYNPLLGFDSDAPGQRSPTCPAARVMIDGYWFEVVNRVEMLNGVLSNYEFHVARLPLNEQLST